MLAFVLETNVAVGIVSAAVIAFLAAAIPPLLRDPTRPPTQALCRPVGADTLGIKRAEAEGAAAVVDGLSPGCTLAQQRGALRHWRKTGEGGQDGRSSSVPRVCVVTGGTGFVGQRLVEMLVERGAERVVSFDVVPKPAGAWDHPSIEWVVGDITDAAAVSAVMEGADCVWHNAAAVGPFHPKALYEKVNYSGTLNVIAACRAHGVHRLVMSSSPSTRFDGSSIDGLTVDEMPTIPQRRYLQAYAESKANGEKACTDACDPPSLMTIAVAPHQVYGPRDNLFLPNVLDAAGGGLLRIFSSAKTGHGMSRVCFTHVDNYAHGLIIAANALRPDSPALGKFYIVTDGASHPESIGYAHLWESIDEMVVSMGFPSLWEKFKLPDWLLYPVARVCDLLGILMGKKLKLTGFNISMLIIHRWFKIDDAVRDLKYEPIIPYDEGWADTAAWFKANWLPTKDFAQEGTFFGSIAKSTERKIDIQKNSAKLVATTATTKSA